MYYGWVVLVVGTLGLMMTTPGQTVGVSVFLDPIIDELGATRAGVSLLYTLGTLAGALALPFVGRAIDRRGPRRAVAWIATGLAGACVYMATVTSLTALAIGFVLLRGLGQGALGLVACTSSASGSSGTVDSRSASPASGWRSPPPASPG